MTLDHQGRVSLRPDLTWWDGPKCLFVGDAKYKNLTGARVPNADLYQMLSYATALGLPAGLLVYAHGEADTSIIHRPAIRHTAGGCRAGPLRYFGRGPGACPADSGEGCAAAGRGGSRWTRDRPKHPIRQAQSRSGADVRRFPPDHPAR